jgi:hypothetical protein
MQKNFVLKAPGKVDQRLVEAVKGDVRKYVKRERRKKLPEGFTEWAFACKTGSDRNTATDCHVDEVTKRIDEMATAGGAQIYIEILARPGNREFRAKV